MEITSYKTVYKLESLFSILSNTLPSSKMISVCFSYSLTSLPLAGYQTRARKAPIISQYILVPLIQIRDGDWFEPISICERILLSQDCLRCTDGNFLPQDVPILLHLAALPHILWQGSQDAFKFYPRRNLSFLISFFALVGLWASLLVRGEGSDLAMPFSPTGCMRSSDPIRQPHFGREALEDSMSNWKA